MTPLKGRNAVVLGLGLTGLSLARYLVRHGARVRVADTRAEPPNARTLAQELPGVRVESGPFSASTFTGADLIVLGSHGYGRVRRMVLGSVASAVVAKAPCSVQVVRSKHPLHDTQTAA